MWEPAHLLLEPRPYRSPPAKGILFLNSAIAALHSGRYAAAADKAHRTMCAPMQATTSTLLVHSLLPAALARALMSLMAQVICTLRSSALQDCLYGALSEVEP